VAGQVGGERTEVFVGRGREDHRATAVARRPGRGADGTQSGLVVADDHVVLAGTVDGPRAYA